MRKKVSVLLWPLLLLVVLFSTNLNVLASTKHTVNESMSWLNGLVGSKVGTGQCVALIKSYYSYLGASPVSGNACDYATNSLPRGWSRVKGGVPQAGDILVYTGAKYGHVAIYAGGTVSYHQNMAGKYVEKKTSWKYNNSWYSKAEGGTKSYWGYIRPDWQDGLTDDLTIDSRYKTPITCVAYKKMDVYNRLGNVESGHYISAGDACKIDEVYTNGLCAVSYPTSNGTRDAYAKFKDFVPNPVSLSSYKAEKAYTTYTHSDKKKKYGSLSVNDACTVVGQTGNMYQLIYPISGGYKLGWIDKGELKDIVKPDPEPDPEPVTIPLAVAKGFFKNKEIVAMAPKKIEFSSTQYISKDDICRIKDVNNTSGKCTVIYPSGSDDVFNASKTVTKTINITDMVTKYSDDYAVYKLTALKDYKVYPTSSKTDDKGRNWQLDKGDEYYTIAKSGSMTEVLYYCNRGAHAGYWKLGWIEIDYYYLDLNGYLDGEYNGKLTGYGYADITINGEKITKVQDYYKQVPYGTTYKIENPTALAGHTYNGVQVGSLSGTVKEKTQVQLNFTTNPPVLQDIYISSNPHKTEYLEGEWLDTSGLAVTARYDDASTQDVTSSCGISGYDSSPGVKTIYVNYGGQETAFTVNVRSKSPTKIEIVSLPIKTVYNTGEEIDLTGLTVKATYDNGTSAVVDDYDVYIDYDSLTSTEKAIVEISYMYNGISQYTTFDFTIIGKTDEDVLGDVNDDGEVDVADAVLIMKHDAGLAIINDAMKAAADVNNDGEIDIADAILIMKYDAGLISDFN